MCVKEFIQAGKHTWKNQNKIKLIFRRIKRCYKIRALEGNANHQTKDKIYQNNNNKKYFEMEAIFRENKFDVFSPIKVIYLNYAKKPF